MKLNSNKSIFLILSLFFLFFLFYHLFLVFAKYSSWIISLVSTNFLLINLPYPPRPCISLPLPTLDKGEQWLRQPWQAANAVDQCVLPWVKSSSLPFGDSTTIRFNFIFWYFSSHVRTAADKWEWNAFLTAVFSTSQERTCIWFYMRRRKSEAIKHVDDRTKSNIKVIDLKYN